MIRRKNSSALLLIRIESMFKYFIDSTIVTVCGIATAYFWGEHVKPGTGLISVFIAGILAILEISLSFDNAVVNAMKLEKM